MNFMRKTISKLLCVVTVLAVVLTMMPAAMVSAAYTERLPRVTVHLLGDSTVTSYETSSSGITGWGQGLEALLSDYVEVNNWAISGLSTNGLLKSLGFANEYAYEEQWTTILKNVQAGDYVFIQFGHNDQKTSSTDEVDVAVEAEISVYKENLAKIITDTTAKGATPILVTPPERQGYATAQETTLAGYPEAMIEVAKANSVAYIDLNSYSKTALEEKTEEALTAYYAVGDKTHFSAEGALDLAKYIASQLSTAAPALAAYVKADYASVTTSAISYGKTYRRMNFQKATTKTEEKGTSIQNVSFNKEFLKSYIVNANGVNEISTSAYREADGNISMQFTSGYSRSLKTYFDALVSNDNTTPFFCYDFSIKLPTANSSGSFIIANSSYKSEVYLHFYSNDSTINMKASAIDSSNFNVNRNIEFKNVEDLNHGGWNKIRVIMDTVNEKYHLFANGKLVCTDIPYCKESNSNVSDNTYAAKNTRYFYVGTPNEINGNTAYFDDIYIRSISEKQAVKMLLEGADRYLEDIVFTSQEERADGYVNKYLYLPANAALTGVTKSFVWGNPTSGGNVTGFSGDLMFNTSTSVAADNASKTIIGEDNDFSSSTAPYLRSGSAFYAPNGYNNNGDTLFQYTPVITVGSTVINKTLCTSSFTIQRRLLINTEDDLEISTPKMFESTRAIAPNGTVRNASNGVDDGTWKQLHGFGVDNTDSEGNVYSAIAVKNVGTVSRKLIIAPCFYEGGKLAEVSAPTIKTVAAGASVDYTWPTAMAKVSENMTAKLIIIDAETLKPAMDVITIQ